MIFSGKNTFSFPTQKELNFNLKLFIKNNINFNFGFSGQNKTLEFKSVEGNIFDPKNSLVYAISSGDALNISGDINENFYSYYINSSPLNLNENKENFSIQNFYFESLGAAISGDLILYGNIPSYEINLPINFISGENITGLIKNTSYNKSFKILNISAESYGFINNSISEKNKLLFLNNFTGELLPQEDVEFSMSTTGINFKSLENVIKIFVETDFAKIIENFNLELINNRIDIYDFKDAFTFNNTFSGQTHKSDIGILTYRSFSMQNNQNTYYTKPLLLSLEYDSGFTGQTSGGINASGFNNINITNFLIGSGYLTGFSSGIVSGFNPATNEINTGIVTQNIFDTEITYLQGNLNQNVSINLSGYSTGEFINSNNFLGTGDGVIITFSNDFISGLDYISGTLSNSIFSGYNNNTLYYTKIPSLNFISGAYITGTVKERFNNIYGSGIINGVSNSLFTGRAYANALGSGYIIGSGFLTGKNINLLVTGKVSGDLNDIEYVKNVSQNIYGFKIATGIVTTDLYLTGYGLCTGNYIGTNNYGNLILATGLNNFKTSGFLNGTGFLTGYGSGILYDKYGSSGFAYSSGLSFYDANEESINVTNTDGGIINGIYKRSGFYIYNATDQKKFLYVSQASPNTFLRWSNLSGWVFVRNNTPIYQSLDNVDTPVESKNWLGFFSYQNRPILIGKTSDYIDYNYNIIGTGYDIINNINLDSVSITSQNFNRNYIFNNITGSKEYVFTYNAITGTGYIPVFNNLNYYLNEYLTSGVITNVIDSGICYYTGLSSGTLPLFISGAATLYTSFGFPIFTSVTGIYNSGYAEIFTIENNGVKILELNSNIKTGSFARDYSNLDVPPNLFLSFWQTDSASFSNSNSPNGQYIYYNNINAYGAPIVGSGYVGDYHYIINDPTSGWQIRRKSSNRYGWSGLKTNNFPLNGWTGIDLSANRSPGQVQKIGIAHLNLRSIDPAFQDRIYFSFAEDFFNLSMFPSITGSGNMLLTDQIEYTGILKSGISNLPIIGYLTGSNQCYVTGFDKNILEIKSGNMFNLISLRPEIQYTGSSLFGSGFLDEKIVKTGYYEDVGSLSTTGYILSQVEFPYSGMIDSFSGYLDNATSKNLSKLNFVINNSSGVISTGINLRQDRSNIQDISGRVRNLLPLNLYPITDYSGYQQYEIYSTGLFEELISGFINVQTYINSPGKFLCTGVLSGELDVSYTDLDSGVKYLNTPITGVLINSYINDTNIFLDGTGLGSGLYDKLVYATGAQTKNIFIIPTVDIVRGVTITGSGLIRTTLNRNISFNVTSGISYYNNPYIEHINNSPFTGYIDSFVATGNVSKSLNHLFNGVITPQYVKTFKNSFTIQTGLASDKNSEMIPLQFDSLNNRYYLNNIFDTGIDSMIIRIDKTDHLDQKGIYAKLMISGQDVNNNSSVIFKYITGGLF